MQVALNPTPLELALLLDPSFALSPSPTRSTYLVTRFCAQFHNVASRAKCLEYLYPRWSQGLDYVSTLHFLLSTIFPTIWSENNICAVPNSRVMITRDMHPERVSRRIQVA
jgi:hypothetical protein